jgi:O-antigen ligase
LNLAIALATFVWLYREKIGFTRLLTAAAAFIGAGAAAMLAFAPEFSRAYWFRVSTSVEYFFQSPDAVLSGRVRSWAVLQNFLVQQPWHALWGVGYKTLPYSDFIGTSTIADNTYLSTLIETGVLGLVALLAFLAVILRESYRAARSTDSHRAFLGTWSLCFWTGQMFQFLSGDLLTYWRVLPAYLCVFALATREGGREVS